MYVLYLNGGNYFILEGTCNLGSWVSKLPRNCLEIKIAKKYSEIFRKE